jgi:hypothetical protein
MSDPTGPILRRSHSRDDDGGDRLAHDGRPVTPRPIRRLNAPSTHPFSAIAAPDHSGGGEHVDDLIAGYALGALEPDERLAVERHAGYCPRCARLLAETRRTAAMLPFVAAPAAPSPDVKATLFSRIAQSSAPVMAERADAFAWARPVSPQRSVTLPGSGTWLDSQPIVDVPVALATRGRRPRRSLVRAAGLSLPVLLTFGLLALFVVPRLLPSPDPENQQLVQLLDNGSTQCTGGDLALVSSSAINSVCGITIPVQMADGSWMWTLHVSNLIDDTPVEFYAVNIPTSDGGYVEAGFILIDHQQGQDLFPKPSNASDGSICITERGQDANIVCPAVTPVV